MVIIILFALIGLVFTGVFVAMQFGWLNVRGSIDARNNSILLGAVGAVDTKPDISCSDKNDVCNWNETREWAVVAGGIEKDRAIIERVAQETNISPRLIAAMVVPEQIRFFTSNREVFKRYFEPLKILGSLSQFSLGVSGIKQETAVTIEKHATNPHSPFYPGESYASLIAYTDGTNHNEALFERLTDDKDHYYSYLYTALFIKEIEAQWMRAGHDISNEPAIIATIFNIGFDGSKPKPNPQVGGTSVIVGGSTYTFGELAGLFYESDELEFLGK